jgi:hypothetical protein
MTLGLCITVFSIIGTIANIYKKKWCFWIWTFSNMAWIIWDVWSGAYPRVFGDSVYLVLALWGMYSWGKDSK